MYQKIKELADEALALQNKVRMDAVLREISALCEARHQSICEQLTHKAHEIADEMSKSLKVKREELEKAVTHLASLGESSRTDTPCCGNPEQCNIACANNVQLRAAFSEPLEDATTVGDVTERSDFGLAHVKVEGGAIHPDDSLQDLSEEQHAKQLAAHKRDVAKPSKKGGVK